MVGWSWVGHGLRGLRAHGRLGPRGLVVVSIALLGAGIEEAEAQETFPPPTTPLVMEALRVDTPPEVDGILDDGVWLQAPVARQFRQMEPDQGMDAPLDTEVRILFDETHLYVGALLRDPRGAGGARTRSLARDFAWFENDAFGITLDPFGDGRIGMAFQVNAGGAQRDQLIFDGTVYQLEWNGVWSARTGETPEGWTVEMAIPWRTLRYPAEPGPWTVNFVRTRRLQGEMTGWSPWPRAFGPYRMEYGGRLVGLEPPAASRPLQLQPYVLGRRVPEAFDPTTQGEAAEVGLDAKWILDPGTALDLTVNTDFAQVEDDRQVVNLSRAAVLFPEQRPFFLENAGLFALSESRLIRPFFSRRMGLDDSGNPVPIQFGGRLTTRRANGSAGFLALRQGEGENHSTFAVARGIRNLGTDSRLGGLVGVRHDQGPGGGTSTTFAADGLWRPSSSAQVLGFVSGSTGGGGPAGTAGYLWASSTTNRGYFGWLQSYVSPHYNPGTGVVARRDLHLTSPAFSLDFRPSWLPTAMRSIEAGVTTYFYHRASDLSFEEGLVTVGPTLVLRDGTELSMVAEPTWQVLDGPFRPLPGVEVTPGRYQYTRWRARLDWAPSARITGSLGMGTGDFYDGRLTGTTASLRAVVSPRVAVGGTYSLDALRGVGEGERTELDARILGSEARLALNPRLQFTLLQQWNSALDTSAWNARVAWEFQPLSYLYLVYNHRQIDGVWGMPGAPVREDRQFIAKLSWLLGS